jgi:hypothetical protein
MQPWNFLISGFFYLKQNTQFIIYNNMGTKEELLETLTNRLKELFVDNYEMVNNSKDDINTYLESIDVDTKYEYNEFCSDFLKISDKLIHSLSMTDIQNVDATYIMAEIMSIMVKYKIMDSEPDENKRLHKLIQHELRTKVVKKNIDIDDIDNIDSS